MVEKYPDPQRRTGSMRAVVYDVVGGRPEVRQVPRPDCPADGVVVDVAATGVCRSDWHAWRGHDPVPLPHTPGHEWAGVVAQVGADVPRDRTGFTVGDRVTAPFVLGCGRCAWCRDGSAQVCPDQVQPGFTYAGSFAEQVVVHAAGTNLVRLPDAVDLVAAAALGCRFATAFRALTGVARVQPGEWVAVLGCGGVGLSAVMIASALGAQVVAVDVSEVARARALELGAVVALPAHGAALAVQELTGGGAHVGLDALGSPATLDASVRSLRRHGRHVQVGLLLGDAAGAPVPWDLVVGRELQLLGSHGMAAVDYPAMLAMVADGRLDPARLVGSVITLDEAGAALAGMDDPSATRGGMTVVALDPLARFQDEIGGLAPVGPRRPGGRGRDVEVEDRRGQVERAAGVRDVDHPADPALDRRGAEQQVRLRAGVAELLQVVDGVEAGVPVGQRRVEVVVRVGVVVDGDADEA